MAVDTRNRRMSLIGLGSPIPSVLPNPDGTIGAADRIQLLWLYPAYALGEVIRLTLPIRSLAMTLQCRTLVLTLKVRSLAMTLKKKRK